MKSSEKKISSSFVETDSIIQSENETIKLDSTEPFINTEKEIDTARLTTKPALDNNVTVVASIIQSEKKPKFD